MSNFDTPCVYLIEMADNAMYKTLMQSQEFKIYLQSELVKRCKVNPSYSLRAFARHLEVEPSYLSKILRGKRPLTQKKIHAFSQHLGINPEINLYETSEDRFRQLSHDQFTVISEWYHLCNS